VRGLRYAHDRWMSYAMKTSLPARVLASVPILIALTVSVWFIPALAMTWPAPLRKLTGDEWLELAVSEADAVVTATVSSYRDSTASAWVSQSVLLHVISVLKGNLEAAEVHAGVIDGDLPEPLATHLVENRQIGVVFAFLRRSDDDWLLNGSPEGVAGGLLPVKQEEVGAVQARITAQLHRLSLDSLVTRADLIVVAHRLSGGAPCNVAGRPWSCPTVAVERVLVGTERARTIRAYSVVLGYISEGPNVFFLRRVDEGLYETIGFALGSVPIGPDGYVDKFALHLSKLTERVAELRPSRK
jgi:hypothetical protein